MSFIAGQAWIKNHLLEDAGPLAITDITTASRVILHNTGEAAGTATVNSVVITVAPGAVLVLDNNGNRTYEVTALEGNGMQVTAIA